MFIKFPACVCFAIVFSVICICDNGLAVVECILVRTAAEKHKE